MCVGVIELSVGIFLLGAVEWGSHKVFHPATVKVCVGSPLNLVQMLVLLWQGSAFILYFDS